MSLAIAGELLSGMQRVAEQAQRAASNGRGLNVALHTGGGAGGPGYDSTVIAGGSYAVAYGGGGSSGNCSPGATGSNGRSLAGHGGGGGGIEARPDGRYLFRGGPRDGHWLEIPACSDGLPAREICTAEPLAVTLNWGETDPAQPVTPEITHYRRLLLSDGTIFYSCRAEDMSSAAAWRSAAGEFGRWVLSQDSWRCDSEGALPPSLPKHDGTWRNEQHP